MLYYMNLIRRQQHDTRAALRFSSSSELIITSDAFAVLTMTAFAVLATVSLSGVKHQPRLIPSLIGFTAPPGASHYQPAPHHLRASSRAWHLSSS